MSQKERHFLKLEITRETREAFEELYRRRGLSQIEAGTRMFAWFMRQDEMIQQMIWGQVPARLIPAAREVLRTALDAELAPRLNPAAPGGALPTAADLLAKGRAEVQRLREAPPATARKRAS